MQPGEEVRTVTAEPVPEDGLLLALAEEYSIREGTACDSKQLALLRYLRWEWNQRAVEER